MTVGSVTISAIVAAALATLVYWIARRLAAPDWLCMFVFGLFLVIVVLAGPLIRLP